jgi:undecaprenyl pyrophosphate phosphatase UppP
VDRSRSLIWGALGLELIALVWEGLWHAVLNPEFEHAVTVEEMRHHLLTVHIPFYVSILALLGATAWAVIQQARHARRGWAMPIGLVAAIGQVIGQVWDAIGHLRLRNGGPVAWTLMILGPIVVAAALVIEARHERKELPSGHRA